MAIKTFQISLIRRLKFHLSLLQQDGLDLHLVGYNMMGNTLMEVRSEFQAELNKQKIPYVKDTEVKSDFEME